MTTIANVTDGQTDGQTDRQTTCDRNTALCTKVHRAVKIVKSALNFAAILHVVMLFVAHPCSGFTRTYDSRNF